MEKNKDKDHIIEIKSTHELYYQFLEERLEEKIGEDKYQKEKEVSVNNVLLM